MLRQLLPLPLDEGNSLEEALAELRPEMWRGLLPGATRAIVKSALSQLFNDQTPAQTEELIRETEATLLKLRREDVTNA